MKTPQQIVLAFIEDYFNWNALATRLCDKEEHADDGDPLDKAEQKYQELIGRYCLPGFEAEPIAFGTESSHDPALEVIVEAHIHQDTAIIKSKHTNASGFISDYEYRLTRQGDRWYLDAVNYIDDEGSYPSL